MSVIPSSWRLIAWLCASFICILGIVSTSSPSLLTFATAAGAESGDEDLSGEDLAIDTPAEEEQQFDTGAANDEDEDRDRGAPVADLSKDSALSKAMRTPIREMPCDVFTQGALIPFDKNRKLMINLLKDVAGANRYRGTGKSSVTEEEEEDQYGLSGARNFVCPASFLAEMKQLLGALRSASSTSGSSSSVASLDTVADSIDAMYETIRSLVLNTEGAFARLGNECAVDLLVLSDRLHVWASEIGTLISAVEHASQDCNQAWAHFLTFLQTGEKRLAQNVPQFRSEKCIFVDEYRACFDV